MFRQEVLRLVRRYRCRWVVLECEAMTDIDVPAAGTLEQLDNELPAVGVHLAFVEMRSRLRDLVSRYGLLQTLDGEHFYDSIEDALAAIKAEDAAVAREAEEATKAPSADAAPSTAPES
jgi:MFS superfamily sulfate permease-like transporter